MVLDAGKKLIQGEWRDGTLQRCHKSPPENIYPLDEKRLCGELGYSTSMLAAIPFYAVAAGAIIEAAVVKVAETVVVGPSGGAFGGLAVESRWQSAQTSLLSVEAKQSLRL
ncbi:hypothetical protein SLS63_009615 [Diaporthe eres]|uniref:Uncharacterized protein n=1 Tax=Diaporthe eres TaxID=83184 RepID=A0ABR1NZ28_DIAER